MGIFSFFEKGKKNKKPTEFPVQEKSSISSVTEGITLNITATTKNNDVETYAKLDAYKQEYEELNNLHGKKVSQIHFSDLEENHEPLTNDEKAFLEYVEGININDIKIAKKWTLNYDLDFQAAFEKFFSYEFIVISDIAFSISEYKIDTLKKFLSSKSLPVSGKKEILVERIIDNVDIEAIKLNFPDSFITFTEKGRNFISIYHKECRDKNFQLYSQRMRESLQSGDLGTYALNLYNSSKILIEEKQYSKALQHLIYVFYLGLWGYDSLTSYQSSIKSNYQLFKPSSFIAPGLVNDIVKVQKELSLSDVEVINILKELNKESFIPQHTLSLDLCCEILSVCLIQGTYEGTEVLKNEHDKFVESFKNQF